MDIKKPRPGTPVTDPAWEEYWDDLSRSTTELGDSTGGAIAKLTIAIAEVKIIAENSQDTADSALLLAQLAKLEAAENSATVKEMLFLGGT